MDKPMLKLKNAPIVEAVLDIECDMPSGREIAALEKSAKDCFLDRYPKFRTHLVQEHRIEPRMDGPPKMSSRHVVQGFQFLQEDEKQLVQVRGQGFSFNRLAPYSSLDDYLPEMERTWGLFAKLASPVQIRGVSLRYINRILLPLTAGAVKLEEYFKICPRLPDEEKLHFVGFFNQHTAVEADTGNQVNIILAAQGLEGNMLPVIFDITAASAGTGEPGNWSRISARIQSLRDLKNRVFQNTLTRQCVELFQK